MNCTGDSGVPAFFLGTRLTQAKQRVPNITDSQTVFFSKFDNTARYFLAVQFTLCQLN